MSLVIPQVAQLSSLRANDVNKEVSKIQNAIGFAKRPLNLTPKQMEEERLKNQCLWCKNKFTPRHKCKNRQLFMITAQDDEKEGERVLGEFAYEIYKCYPSFSLEDKGF